MRYLLQTLSEEERERFEEGYFSDDSEFEELEIAEEELVDRYVRGELSPGEKDRFDKMLAGSPLLLERVKVAKVFAKKISATSLPVVKSSETSTSERIPEPAGWWNKFFGFSSAFRLAPAFGVLLIMMGSAALLVAWLQIRETSRQQTALAERQRELDKQEAALKAQAEELAKRGQQVPVETPIPSPSPQAPALQPTFASLTLSPGTMRSGGGANDVRIRPETTELRITLRLRDTDYPSYRASVVNANRAEVFPISDLKPRVTKNVASLNFRIPAKLLPPNDYMVRVFGGPPGAANESVAEYVFRVVK